MAMFYQGSSEIQADGHNTLYLMNPSYTYHTDTQHQAQPNTVFLNPTAVHSLDSSSVPHVPLPQAQQFVGIPLSNDPTRPSSVLGQLQEIPRFQYNPWDGNQPNTAQQHRQQSLSLSLSPHQFQTGLNNNKQIPADPHQDFSVGKISSHHVRSSSIGTNGHVIMGSKYLKAAQQLLDEVANVGQGIIAQTDRAEPEKTKDKSKIIQESGTGEASSCGGESCELTTAQRQEILMKKAKLINMLDEVEQRYKQYHQQMQMKVGSFEQAAGFGSGKTYTQLALKTISKQFRCLKDAITSEIKGLSKRLGEEEALLINIGDKSSNWLEMSRINKFVDNEMRQQRAMQQLGMIQNNAWRPQRGLPERAVSVLRAWLFEHFLHPYPKDSDKQMLAKQTGLTRSQVSNWFINARVRLWKPMVEEMYQEEIKNQEKTTSIHHHLQDNTSKIPGSSEIKEPTSKFPPPHDQNNRMDHIQIPNNQENLIPNPILPSPTDHQLSASNLTTSPTSLPPRTNFAQLITSLNIENLPEKSPKKPRTFDMSSSSQDNSPSSILSVEMDMRAGDTTKSFQFTRENYLSSMANGPAFGSYGIMGELGRFNGLQTSTTGFHAGNNSNYMNNNSNNSNNNNVSLTLGLPPSAYSASGNFEFGTRTEMGAGNNRANQGASSSHTNIGYGTLDFQNRKPYASQILPDFMA